MNITKIEITRPPKIIGNRAVQLRRMEKNIPHSAHADLKFEQDEQTEPLIDEVEEGNSEVYPIFTKYVFLK